MFFFQEISSAFICFSRESITMDKHNLGKGCAACAASHPHREDQLSLCLAKPWPAGAAGTVWRGLRKVGWPHAIPW